VLQQAMDLTMRVFGRRAALTPHPLDEYLFKFVQREKSSGLPDLQRKGDTYEVDLARAIRIAAGTRAPDPCTGFHRVQHGDEGPKTRLVWGYPLSMFFLEARFAPLLIEEFLDNATPMAFGLFKSQVSARMQQIRNSGLRYSLDFSGFDSSIAPEFIDFAFGVLRTHFDMNDEQRSCWNKIVNYFIHTPIMMPDQEVWVKHHGVPSGSYFTQMIDTIVNYLAVTYAWMRAGGQPIPDDKILVLGDDSVFGESKYVSLELLKVYFNELGIVLNDVKSGISHWGRDDPHFLGHYWRRGFPDRPEREIAIRLAFPEKPVGIKDALERRNTRTLGYVGDAVSAHRIIMGLSKPNTGNIAAQYASFLFDGDGIRKLPPHSRPGWTEFLEELGTMDSATADFLAFRGPFVSLYY